MEHRAAPRKSRGTNLRAPVLSARGTPPLCLGMLYHFPRKQRKGCGCRSGWNGKNPNTKKETEERCSSPRLMNWTASPANSETQTLFNWLFVRLFWHYQVSLFHFSHFLRPAAVIYLKDACLYFNLITMFAVNKLTADSHSPEPSESFCCHTNYFLLWHPHKTSNQICNHPHIFCDLQIGVAKLSGNSHLGPCSPYTLCKPVWKTIALRESVWVGTFQDMTVWPPGTN